MSLCSQTLADAARTDRPYHQTGLVFFPSILPERLQRSLVIESLKNAKSPNVTSLDPHYRLPREGLWNASTSGRGDETVERIDYGVIPSATPTSDTKQPDDSSESLKDALTRASTATIDAKAKEVTVRELVRKLRWANVGYHYNVQSASFTKPIPFPR